MGQQDKAIKNLISHPDIFADIINVLVYNGNKILTGDSLCHVPERKSAIADNGILKELIRDVCMADMENGTNYLIYGIENQDDVDETMPLRLMGYDYMSYRSQVEELQKRNKQNAIYPTTRKLLPGQKLVPVVTLVLHYGKDKWDGPRSIKDMLELPEKHKYKSILPYIQNYTMNLISLRDLGKEQTDKFLSDFRCIAKYLSKDYNDYTYIEELKRDKTMLHYTKDTLLAMAALTKDMRYLNVATVSGEEETAMCGVCDELERRGMKKGMEAGMEAGIDLMTQLIRNLAAEGRMDDVIRAAEDASYRKQLFLLYNIDEKHDSIN